MITTITKLVLFVWLLISVGCGSSTEVHTTKKSSDHNIPVFNIYEIPTAEHGYGQLDSQVIRSEYALNAFIRKVDEQPHWNNKAAFIASLRKTPIDFSHYALVLFFHDEDSSMISVSLGKPKWNPTDNSVHIPLYNDVKQGEFLTTDMAYYGYAFVADNRLSVAELHPTRSAQKSNRDNQDERLIVNYHYSYHAALRKQSLQLTSNTCC